MKKFKDSLKDQDDDYWIKKNLVPRILYRSIKNYFDKDYLALDLGCAGARLSRSMVGHFRRVYAVDVSESILIKSSLINPEISFVCGDFSDERTWKLMNQKFDVIVSDCAVRKDYVDLDVLSVLCEKYLNNNGVLIFRLQGVNDLVELLPDKKIREKLFYSDVDLKKCFSNFNDVQIKTESYKQKFSSEKYLLSFLDKVNIEPAVQELSLNIFRQYYLLEARK